MANTYLPIPKSETLLPGWYAPEAPVALHAAAGLDRRTRRAVQWSCGILPFETRFVSGGESAGEGAILVQVKDGGSDSESYVCEITEGGVSVLGAGPAGAFYGLQTLLQIGRLEGRRWRCRRIADDPDLAIRGVSMDVSRGKVPTLETLEALIDRLAGLKINHLQLYVEHTYDFRFDRDIARGCSGLTDRDFTRLAAYCHERFIDLVPSLACFGHMGRILSLPQYRRLAEIECSRSWESQTWAERVRGLTIDPRNPEARKLLERMLDEFLPLFASRFANVCADETHDLGRGRNESYCRRVGRGRLYVDHLKFLAAVCARHGKRMMFWGDVVRSFPELLVEMPEDAVLLDWGYEADSEFAAVNDVARGSRQVCVCPGTGGWNRVVNAMGTADANIQHASRTAGEHGAAGLIVTDWGDHGHFNMPACSLPAIAHAAARAWNTAPIDGETLELAIESLLFGTGSSGRLAALRRMSRIGDTVHTWPALYAGIREADGALRIGELEAESLKEDAEAAAACLGDAGDPADRVEWLLACQASSLVAEKALLAHAFEQGNGVGRARVLRFADDIESLADRYEGVWRMRNRPHRFKDVRAALLRLSGELRDLGSDSSRAGDCDLDERSSGGDG